MLVGPTVIKKMISTYSNGHVIASSVIFTPDLNIKIGRLDYLSEEGNGKVERKSFSRSINIFWSVMDNKPFLSAKIGPTVINNNWRADSIHVNLPPFSEMDFREILINTEINNLNSNSTAFIDEVDIKAKYLRNEASLRDISIETASFRFDEIDMWFAPSVSAHINKYDLTRPQAEQDFIFDLSIENLENLKRKIQISEVKSLFNFNMDQIGFETKIRGLSFADLGYTIEEAKADGIYLKNGSMKTARVEVLNEPDGFDYQEKSRVVAEISNVDMDNYNITISGNLAGAEISFEENFIGTLPESNLEMELFWNNTKNKINAETAITLKNSVKTKLSGNGELRYALNDSAKIFECYRRKCEIEKLNFDYKLKIDDQWVDGEAACYLLPCEYSTIKHTLTTYDTLAVFEAISRSKIINPLFSAYLFALLNSGKSLGNGHEISFN